MSCFDLDGTPLTGCYAYICPQSGRDECIVHGGFSTCCAHPDCPSKTDLGVKAAARRLPIQMEEGLPFGWAQDAQVPTPVRLLSVVPQPEV